MDRTRELHGDRIRADLRNAKGKSYQGRVLRTSVGDESFLVELRYEGEIPKLEEGEEVLLSFSGNALVGRPTVRCEHVRGEEPLAAGNARFLCRLDGTRGLTGLTERRGTPRIRMRTGPEVELRLRESRQRKSWNAKLTNLSQSGLQVAFATRSEPGFQLGHEVELIFRLEEQGPPFHFYGEIAYRHIGNGVVSCGIVFQRESTDDFHILEGRLFGALIALACGPPA
jgi:hypothetical protein